MHFYVVGSSLARSTIVSSVFILIPSRISLSFFFFTDTAPTETYPLSLPDALPISGRGEPAGEGGSELPAYPAPRTGRMMQGRRLLRPYGFKYLSYHARYRSSRSRR